MRFGDISGIAYHQFITFAAHPSRSESKAATLAASNLERIGAARLVHASETW